MEKSVAEKFSVTVRKVESIFKDTALQKALAGQLRDPGYPKRSAG